MLALDRRQFCHGLTGALATSAVHGLIADDGQPWKLHYILASCRYGVASLAEILPEVAKTGARHIDLWPKPRGDQREQLDKMGDDAFAALLETHNAKLGILTRYDLGCRRLQPEKAIAKKFGARLIVTGSRGPKGLAGPELRTALALFVEEMKPHVEAAEEHGVVIAIENHSNSLIDSPDSLRWFAELSTSKHLGIALAPHHLPQEAGIARRSGSRLRRAPRPLLRLGTWKRQFRKPNQ